MVLTKNDNKRTAVARVVLVEARNLPIHRPRKQNVYCSMRLKKQKEKSSSVAENKNPIWKEIFEFYLYEELHDELVVKIRYHNPLHKKDGLTHNDEIGKVTIDIGSLKPEATTDVWKYLDSAMDAHLHLLVTISGISNTNCSFEVPNITNGDVINTYFTNQISLSRSLLDNEYAGKLLITVHRAEGLPALEYLGGQADSFCELKVGREFRRTQTVYRKLNPIWNKHFEINVRDVCECVDISVYDEETDKKHRLLGRLKIPLLFMKNIRKKWYTLKDKDLRNQAKGDNPKILLEIDFAYNTVQAAINAFKPKKEKYENPGVEQVHFDRKIVARHIQRLMALHSKCQLEKVLAELNHILNWENKFKSTIFLLIYTLVIYCFQPWMITFFILLVVFKQSFYLHMGWIKHSKGISYLDGLTSTRDNISFRELGFEQGEDILNEEEKKKKTSIRDTIHRFQDIYDSRIKIQKSLQVVVQFGERINNLFQFKVQFLSSIVVALLIPITLILYLIPLRYIILLVGVDQILKGLIRPNSPGSITHLIHMISKIPDNEEWKDWTALSNVPLGLPIINEKSPLRNRKANRINRQIFVNRRLHNRVRAHSDSHLNKTKDTETGGNSTVKLVRWSYNSDATLDLQRSFVKDEPDHQELCNVSTDDRSQSSDSWSSASDMESIFDIEISDSPLGSENSLKNVPRKGKRAKLFQLINQPDSNLI